MAETVESADAPAAEDATEPSLTELLEELARELNVLAVCEARLAAARHKPELRRAGGDVAAAALAALALLSAFVFANAAAALGLARVMPGWAAALVLAAAWVAVGVVLALYLRGRVARAAGWDGDAEEARAEALDAIRETLERLSPLVTKEIALAAIPMTDDMAEGVLDAGSELIENADDMVETLAENVPGGGVVNQMWDVVLMPGRLGIRVATTVLRRGDSGG
jgi:hypothetical protein